VKASLSAWEISGFKLRLRKKKMMELIVSTCQEHRFNDYCDIAKYYQANVPLACVNPSFVNLTGTTMVVPSLIQILGLALLLHNEKVQPTGLTLNLTENVKPCIDALNAVANKKESLVNATSGSCMVAEIFKTMAKYTLQDKTKVDALRNYAFYKVSKLSEDDVNSILKYFKIAMFCYKFFPVYPTENLDTLTFTDFFRTSPDAPTTTNYMKTFVVDKDTFAKAVAFPSYTSHKVVFYTPANLSASAANASSAASVAPSPSSSVDARLAALETAVAAIQAKLA
jgi:hypothetical protein